jgi:hypothetical protein
MLKTLQQLLIDLARAELALARAEQSAPHLKGAAKAQRDAIERACDARIISNPTEGL